jgi:tetratricopeptide (TPR) repeat protein
VVAAAGRSEPVGRSEPASRSEAAGRSEAGPPRDGGGLARERVAAATELPELAELLRWLRRREARRRGGSELTYRELAASTGWSHAIVGQYLTGKVLPPTDRFDTLTRLLGAAPVEQGMLATARDRVAEGRRAAEQPAAPPVSAVPPVATPGRPAPEQLPADAAGFTGRTAELSELDGLLSTVDGLVVAAVSGTAGVGKTALAVHWAHRVRRSFPDGQLYVNLRGYDPEQPVPPADALAGFLRALGVPGLEIPADLAERAARFRTEVSGRRLLVLLDNAASVEQVRPLLPGTPTCLVVVTSRDSLAGLIAQHGAHRLPLDRLPAPDAVELLRRLIGPPVSTHPAAAARLADQCVRLPLALRVAAELALSRAPKPLPELVAELDDLRGRLDLLDAGGDPRIAVAAVFSWSYRHLPAAAGRAFRLLGLHPGADWAADAASALIGDPAGRPLELLSRAHLIQRSATGRYGMHDLLRAYAAGLAVETDSEGDRTAALTGLCDHYLSGAAGAMDVLFPAEAHRRPRVASATVFEGRDAAQRWLDAELANLVAVAGWAAEHGRPDHAVRFAGTLFRYLDSGVRSPDALAVHTHALRAARRAGDRAGEADALTNLGGVYWRWGRYREAIAHVEQALAVHRAAGDRRGQARALANLGKVFSQQGSYQPAVERLRAALDLFRRLGDRVGEARTLDHLGYIAYRQGELDRAVAELDGALAVFESLGDRLGEAEALGHLGATYAQQRRYEPAAGALREALARYREGDHRDGEAYALANLGLVCGQLGDLAAAAEHLSRACDLYERAGNPAGQAEALANLELLALARPG